MKFPGNGDCGNFDLFYPPEKSELAAKTTLGEVRWARLFTTTEICQGHLSQHRNCYDFCMYVRPLQLLAILCLAGVCLAQSPEPSNTYTLHAQKERRAGFSLVPTVALPSTMLVATPDNALLVLIPQTEGEWALKRLSGWDTNHPQEQTLTIKGNSSSNKDVSVATDMLLDPHGAYLLLRIDSRLGAIDSPNRIREAVVNVIDLHSFTIISRRVTTDPLFASSQWQFSRDDQLISKGIAKRLSAKTASVNTVTDAYDAAALKLLIHWFREDWALFQHPRMDDSRAKDLLSEILDDGEIMRQTFVPANDPHRRSSE